MCLGKCGRSCDYRKQRSQPVEASSTLRYCRRYHLLSVLALIESTTSHRMGSNSAKAADAFMCGSASEFLVIASKSSRLRHWAYLTTFAPSKLL